MNRCLLKSGVRWIAVFLLLALVSAVFADELPLRDGRTVNVQILRIGPNGVYVRGRYGSLFVPWTQISPRFPMHPDNPRLHPERRPKGAGKSGTAATRGGPAPGRPRPAGRREESAARSGPGKNADAAEWGWARSHPFPAFLLLSFLVFWLNIFSVWLVSREELVGGGRLQLWNLAALVFGLPVALLFLLRYKGLRGAFSFERRAKDESGQWLPAKGAKMESCLFTWDGQPIKPKRGARKNSGLVSAQALLGRAVQMNASDIHLDTTPYNVEVKFRVDGVLRPPETLPLEVGKRTMAAIKMAAGIDVAKRQEAQDGACHLAVNNEWFDVRVARAWAVNGETLTVRLLRSAGVGGELTDLGMSQTMADALLEAIQDTAGIIILAGPTGSGKTSTIYALLRRVVGTGRNIVTIEDPVEYRLEGATQISLNARTGATFASALKASMRHDPDVILVGEIRDAETMEVAFQAALTGHLVFTTIHATGILGAIGRLHEMGLSPYMINTGLKAIVCQRLVRLLCPSCREPYEPDPGELAFWGIPREEAAGRFFYRPVGCHLCEDTGYHGRRGVFRMLFMNNELRDMIRPDVPIGELQRVVEKYVYGQPEDYVRSLLWTGDTSPEEFKKTLDMFDFGKRLARGGAGDSAFQPTAPPPGEEHGDARRGSPRQAALPSDGSGRPRNEPDGPGTEKSQPPPEPEKPKLRLRRRAPRPAPPLPPGAHPPSSAAEAGNPRPPGPGGEPGGPSAP